MKNYQNPSHLAVTLSEAEIQDILLGRMKTAALSLVTSLFEQDVERLCGQRFSHKKEGKYRRGGSEKTSVVVSGAKQPIRRPRVRGDNGEVHLPSYQTLRSGDILDQRMMTHMVEGISTRSYERVAEEYSDRFGISKSAVSRAFVRSSQKDLDLVNGSELSEHRFLALSIDGICFAKRMIVVALGVTSGGDKIVLGLRDGATENSEVVKDLLASLIDRGFALACESLLVCLDGSSALRKAVVDTFGNRAVIQRCYLHKIKNLKGYIPEENHGELITRIRRMMAFNTFEQGYEELYKLQEWVDTFNQEAANSLREVGTEMLTLHRLGITGPLRKSLSSTNLIESIFSVVRSKCSRVKNWRSSPTTRMRWVASAAVAHQPRMRKVRGLKQLSVLETGLNALEKEVAVG